MKDRQLILTGVDYTKVDTLFTQMCTSLKKFFGQQAASGNEMVDTSGKKLALLLKTFIMREIVGEEIQVTEEIVEATKDAIMVDVEISLVEQEVEATTKEMITGNVEILVPKAVVALLVKRQQQAQLISQFILMDLMVNLSVV